MVVRVRRRSWRNRAKFSGPPLAGLRPDPAHGLFRPPVIRNKGNEAMNRISIALASASLLALSACGSPAANNAAAANNVVDASYNLAPADDFGTANLAGNDLGNASSSNSSAANSSSGNASSANTSGNAH
jgi:hypothetical protein